MSWFKKIFGSQSSQSSQEPKVCYSKKEREGEKEKEKLTSNEFIDCDEVESTQDDSQSSCYSWSGVSQALNIKGEKRNWDESEDEEEEKQWAAFQSQPSTQASTTSQGASSQKIEEKNDDDDDDEYDQTQTQTQTQTQDETEKNSFYLKMGKYKKFKFM